MTHILIPREPSTALLRPFIGCNSQELHEAWAAMVRIAEVQHARAGSQCLAQIEEPAQPIAGYRISDPSDPTIKPWLSETPDDNGYKSEPLYAGAAPAAVAGPAEPLVWTPGPNEFKDWCAQWFGPDSDDNYLAEAVHALPPMAQRFARLAAAPALEAPAHQCCNSWFLSLPEGRQAVLRENQWMLADAAYQAGRESSRALEAPAAPPNDIRDAALWREHVQKLDALVAYCPTCTQGFAATGEMTRDQIIFECGKTAGRSAAAPQAPAAPAVDAPAKGEVVVEVHGLTGSGKSAICGEIEIMCRALGLEVAWPGGESEKRMTHAEWTAAIEAYKPRVRIVERNVPRQSNGGPAK